MPSANDKSLATRLDALGYVILEMTAEEMLARLKRHRDAVVDPETGACHDRLTAAEWAQVLMFLKNNGFDVRGAKAKTAGGTVGAELTAVLPKWDPIKREYVIPGGGEAE